LPLMVPCLAVSRGVAWFLVGSVAGGTFFAALFTVGMRAGPYGFLHRLLRKVGLAKEGGVGDEASRRIDDHSRELGRDRAAFRRSIVWFVLGWAWGILELMLI